MGVQISCGVHPQVSAKGAIRSYDRNLGEVFRELARRRDREVIEGHLLVDHMHLLVSIPPKCRWRKS